MKVLIVDDEKIGRDSLKALLSSFGFAAQTASNGLEALEIAASFQPDFVVIDWILGDQLDGLGVAKALRKVQPAVGIVIVSGDSAVTRKAPLDASYHFLLKPFRIAELLALFGDASGHD